MAFADDDNNKRSWLGALLAFLDSEGREPAGGGDARQRVDPPRRASVVERALERRGPARSNGGIERCRTRDETLSARADLSGIRFWPSEAIGERKRPSEGARSAS